MSPPASRLVSGVCGGGVWPFTTTRWAGKAAILAVAATWPPRRRWLVQAGPARPGESAARLCGTISAGVQAGLNDAAADDTRELLKGHRLSAFKSLREATNFDGLRLKQFLSLLELRAGEAGRLPQAEELVGALARAAQRTPDYSIDVLKERIRFLATTSGTHDPVVRQRTVLRCSGLAAPDNLLPPPPPSTP